MKIPLYILMIIIISSCSTYEFKDIYGTYGSKNDEPNAFLDLRKDSTFIFIWKSGSTAGKWSLNRNKITLNSDSIKPISTSSKFHIIDSLNNDSNKITFDLLHPDGTTPLYNASGLLYRKGKLIEKQNSDFNGRILFKKQHFDSLKIASDLHENIILKNIDYDYYKIVTTNLNFNLIHLFDNKQWKIKKGCCLFDETNNDFYKNKKLYRGD